PLSTRLLATWLQSTPATPARPTQSTSPR
ncbi:antibiotic biosynthesis monooxygenase, partial [Pseudomonas syringae pv. actinidiae]|nr:antibiotic biosynthesis monooxygenase [Pseudomonas syringae pv. actinidiae]